MFRNRREYGRFAMWLIALCVYGLISNLLLKHHVPAAKDHWGILEAGGRSLNNEQMADTIRYPKTPPRGGADPNLDENLNNAVKEEAQNPSPALEFNNDPLRPKIEPVEPILKASPKRVSIVENKKDQEEKSSLQYTCRYGKNDTEILVLPPGVPSFVLVGVQKSGTTSLLSYFKEHPNMLQTVRGARREVHFFDSAMTALLKTARHMKMDFQHKFCFCLKHYMQYFDTDQIMARIQNQTTTQQQENASNLLYTFEKTPSYFSSRDVPYRMRKVVPWSKVILILRNPVDRAYSQYKMTIQNEPVMELKQLTMEAFINHEVSQMRKWHMTTSPLLNASQPVPFDHPIPVSEWKERLEKRDHYWDAHMLLRKGLYSVQLEWWLEHYEPNKNMLVINHADLERDTESVYRRILEFSGIPADPRGSYEDIVSKRTRRDKRAGYNPLSNATRDYLSQFFAPYNAKLEALLGPEWSVDKLQW